jgi:hypothetical protein
MYYAVAGKGKRLLGALLRVTGRRLCRYPTVMSWIRPQEMSGGRVWQKLKRVMFDVDGSGVLDSSFTRIQFDAFNVFFSNGPLADKRGIGRVCREQLQR